MADRYWWRSGTRLRLPERPPPVIERVQPSRLPQPVKHGGGGGGDCLWECECVGCVGACVHLSQAGRWSAEDWAAPPPPPPSGLNFEVQRIGRRGGRLWPERSGSSGASAHSCIVHEQRGGRGASRSGPGLVTEGGGGRVGLVVDITASPRPQRLLEAAPNELLLCPLASQYGRRTMFGTN